MYTLIVDQTYHNRTIKRKKKRIKGKKNSESTLETKHCPFQLQRCRHSLLTGNTSVSQDILFIIPGHSAARP